MRRETRETFRRTFCEKKEEKKVRETHTCAEFIIFSKIYAQLFLLLLKKKVLKRERERDERVVFYSSSSFPSPLTALKTEQRERITEHYHTRRPSFFETEEDIPRDGSKKTFVVAVVIFLSTVARLV